MLPVRPALLCVNPDPSTSRLLESVAEGWGFVLYNLSGHLIEQGMSRSGTPGVILVDTTNTNGGLPGLIEGLKSRWPACPIVAIIDTTIRNPADYCLRAGLYDYVTKPIDADRLQMTLRRACDHARLSSGMHVAAARPSDRNTPTASHMSAAPRSSVPKFDDVERDLIVQAIRVCRGNVPDIARCTGISEATIYRKIRKYNLAPMLRSSRNALTTAAAAM